MPDNAGPVDAAAERPSAAAMLAAPLAERVLAPAGSDLVVAEWTEPAGVPGRPRLMAPLHRHRRDDEAWYVLDGVLRFRLDDREVEARAGSAVVAPRGVAHTFWNPGLQPARYLIVTTANTQRLIDELHALTDRSRESVRALFERYDVELL